ncbi:hypothetical protein POTOM_006067 [Populus tomentosa]|uniref:Uncharacterized protein n=1 Tax=Populus tomentosa TaxID=118781 RepID=A0A8X8AMJ5_POPTO|nr:hypothetical protein POTOM_006067 [Populus tomentosa]
MLFKWPLFCFRRCSSSSPPTGREIQQEEAAGPTCENVGSICDDKGGCKNEEANSPASRSRKSFTSFAFERGFLKWVLRSNDKDRGLYRERETVRKGRKDFSDSPKMEREPEAANVVQEAKHVKTVNSKVMAEEKIIRGRNSSKGAGDNEAMEGAAGNGKENVKEDNILYFQEPPSFRIYCVHNVSVDGDSNGEIREPGSGKKKKSKI